MNTPSNVRAPKLNRPRLWCLLAILALGLYLKTAHLIHFPGKRVVESDPGLRPTAMAKPESGEPFGRRMILPEGEALKWLPPTDDPERLAACVKAYPEQANRITNGMIKSLIFAQEGTVLEKPRAVLGVGDPLDPKGLPLPVALHIFTSLPAQLIECDKESSMTMVPGDLVYRKGASPKDICRRASDIFTKACGRPIQVDVVEETEQVWVARGQFRLQPVSASNPWIEVYGQTLVGRDKGTFSGGSFANLLSGVGDYIEPKRAIVSEVADPPKENLAWHLNDELVSPVGSDDHGDTKVLQHLTSQTGLSFSLDRRPVTKIKVTAPR